MANLQPDRLFGGIAFVGVAAVAAALVTQHVFDMQPCPWCVLQRLLFLVIALVALLGLAWRAPAGRVTSALLVLLFALAGVASALWQHFVAAASASCNLTLADRVITTLRLDTLLPDVFSPRASCADAAVHLFGLSYEFWSLGLFVALAGVALRLLLQRR